MKRRNFLKLSGSVATLAVSTTLPKAVYSNTAEYGTAEEAVAMVERAIALIDAIGLEAAAVEFQRPDNTDFHDRDLYIFIADSQGNNVVHGNKPHINGINLYDITDVNGKYYVREMIEEGLNNSPTWVDYWLDSPTTGTIVAKKSYIVKIADDLIIGAGVYSY